MGNPDSQQENLFPEPGVSKTQRTQELFADVLRNTSCGLVLSSVSRCLEPVMKHEARVFDMSSQMKQ